MKTLSKNGIILFLIFSVSACSESLIETSSRNMLHSDSECKDLVAYPKKNKTRALTSENADWESWSNIKLSSGQNPPAPWNPISTPSSIPTDIARDIKAVDGWDLIAHTVNDYGSNGCNYLIFHNKFSGIMKVFYYLENISSSLQNNAIWKIHIDKPHSLFAFSGDMAKTSQEKSTDDLFVTNITNNDTKGFDIGWNCFQFELAYDPNFVNGSIQIMPFNKDIDIIELDGEMVSVTKGTIVSTTTSNGLDAPVKSVARLAGNSAEKWLQDKFNNADESTRLSPLLIKGAGSIVSAGISRLLGSFIGGFNKKNETTQTVMLNTTGNVSIQGNKTSVVSGQVSPLTISLAKENVGSLGVWCMKELPYAELNPYAYYIEPDAISRYSYKYKLDLRNYLSSYIDYISINSDLRESVSDININSYLYKSGDSRYYFHSKNSIDYHPLELWDFSEKTHLFGDFYKASKELSVSLPLLDEKGMTLAHEEVKEPPYEIFIPNAPNGMKGALPDFSFSSNYVIVVEIDVTTKNGDHVVTSHTFPADVRWSEFDDWYINDYPAVPVLKNK